MKRSEINAAIAHAKDLLKQNNITLPLTPPPHADMEKLRAILRSGALDYDGALRILANHRQGEKA